MSGSANFKSKNKRDLIRVQSECEVQDHVPVEHDAHVQRVRFAIALYFFYRTKWVAVVIAGPF